MAHKKGGGSTKNGRDSNPQFRGCKAFAGQQVTGGSILVRQCGNKFWPGANVGQGRDFTLFAKIPGTVQYAARNNRRYISIVSEG
ncbi:MAG TPA: 50S ribosomal protein L27 [Candidatus Sumerlaeota bacterium]|nr:MAG: 50S ribosomal protein L27 [candidate division BRC1 bacterium ADurb.BinA292]HOE97955.1 50S ribosomal protein L27 [Candidatus Sumerlaeota bacterium]HPK03402.1 50S ribosomal protein L27 [Candidatus Sumerlaeota bacterium]